MRRSLAAFLGAISIVAVLVPLALAPAATAAPSAPAAVAPWTGSPSGNPYWRGWDIARGVTTLPDGSGGYVVDGYGGVHPFSMGTAPRPPAARGFTYWQGWDIARGVALLPNGTGGYVLDGWGGLHPFATGSNPMPPLPRGGPYWRGWDIARGVALLPDGTGGYVLDGWGGLTPFAVGSNPIPPRIVGAPYWPGRDTADDLTFLPGGGVLVVDGRGRTYDAALPGQPFPGRPNELGRWGSWDIIRGIAALPDRNTLVLDGYGGLHRYGPPSTGTTNYSFMATDPDGSAVRYDPCAPVHWVMNPAAAPAGALTLVQQAFAQLADATGLRFVYDGTTTEAASTSRSTINLALYGNRPAPILVAWTTPTVVSALAGGVAGLGGSATTTIGLGRRAFVSGLALFDGPQLGQYPTGWGAGITQGDVVLHELGHVVGLAHVNDTTEIMNPSATDGYAGLGTGDRAGLRRLGADLGCNAPTSKPGDATAAGTPAGPTDGWVLQEVVAPEPDRTYQSACRL